MDQRLKMQASSLPKMKSVLGWKKLIACNKQNMDMGLIASLGLKSQTSKTPYSCLPIHHQKFFVPGVDLK